MESTDIQPQDIIVNLEIINEESENEETVVKLKRGRKPKDKPEIIEPKIPKKVGRPKKEQTEPIEPKKRGRKPSENPIIIDKEYHRNYYNTKLKRESQCKFCKKTFCSPNSLSNHLRIDGTCLNLRMMMMNNNLRTKSAINAESMNLIVNELKLIRVFGTFTK
jgi:hypothetical protein